eukprot:10709347-Alexandrium_andersonii.AAC.1
MRTPSRGNPWISVPSLGAQSRRHGAELWLTELSQHIGHRAVLRPRGQLRDLFASIVRHVLLVPSSRASLATSRLRQSPVARRQQT